MVGKIEGKIGDQAERPQFLSLECGSMGFADSKGLPIVKTKNWVVFGA